MFKLAVFSIILFVLSFSATAEEPPPNHTKNDDPCTKDYPTSGQVALDAVELEAYRNCTDEFVTRQQNSKNGTRPMNETREPHLSKHLYVMQFDSFERTQTLGGNFEEAVYYSFRKFAWLECTYGTVRVRCEQLNDGKYLCTFSTECTPVPFLLILLGLLVVGISICCIVCHCDKARKTRREAVDLEKTEEELTPKIVVQNNN